MRYLLFALALLALAWPAWGADVHISQGTALLNAAPTVSLAATPATATLAGVSGTRICIRTIAVYPTGAAGAASLTVSDGATVVLDLGSPALATIGVVTLFQGQPLVCGSVGNAVTVNIGAGIASEITHTSVIADRQ